MPKAPWGIHPSCLFGKRSDDVASLVVMMIGIGQIQECLTVQASKLNSYHATEIAAMKLAHEAALSRLQELHSLEIERLDAVLTRLQQTIDRLQSQTGRSTMSVREVASQPY